MQDQSDAIPLAAETIQAYILRLLVLDLTECNAMLLRRIVVSKEPTHSNNLGGSIVNEIYRWELPEIERIGLLADGEKFQSRSIEYLLSRRNIPVRGK